MRRTRSLRHAFHSKYIFETPGRGNLFVASFVLSLHVRTLRRVLCSKAHTSLLTMEIPKRKRPRSASPPSTVEEHLEEAATKRRRKHYRQLVFTAEGMSAPTEPSCLFCESAQTPLSSREKSIYDVLQDAAWPNSERTDMYQGCVHVVAEPAGPPLEFWCYEERMLGELRFYTEFKTELIDTTVPEGSEKSAAQRNYSAGELQAIKDSFSYIDRAPGAKLCMRCTSRFLADVIIALYPDAPQVTIHVDITRRVPRSLRE